MGPILNSGVDSNNYFEHCNGCAKLTKEKE